MPLEALIKKFAHQRFEPSGFTRNPNIRNASSIIDYVFRWLGYQFVPGYPDDSGTPRAQGELAIPGLVEEQKKKLNRPVPDLPITDDTDIIPNPGRGGDLQAKGNGNGNGNGHGNGHSSQASPAAVVSADVLTLSVAHFQLDAPACPKCGHVTVRNGACYKCLNCGESLGCS